MNMNQAQRDVDTNVHLHAEVQFVALSGLVHLWRPDGSVTLASLVLCRTGSRDNDGVDNAAFARRQALLSRCFFTSLNSALPRPCC